ncbi:hypothetical protein CEE37_05170 [candidate division LCP-89 bacterium B3_LCP]|uniref:SatD family (SatD) n=1 Tax=candidate division LCP-89 bacterium B3_LCP TaxID=2012998 RepID=A0A532V1L5_UNCL8|nr:MAG: hypothetical protein CEE37_05170 [candidate division LCP-89 bacterium B3_LCP]
MSKHCAIIGDIKGSRDLDNWPETFQKLTEILQEVNRRYSEEILIEFNPTIGDEFQGALRTPERAFDVYTFIKASLPVQIYCGMGIGEIEKSQDDDKGLRGSAFYRAREALEECKNQELSLIFKSQNQKNHADETINIILMLIWTIESSWTDRQKEIVNCFRLHPDYTLSELGGNFRISQPTVSSILKASNYQDIYKAETHIAGILRVK